MIWWSFHYTLPDDKSGSWHNKSRQYHILRIYTANTLNLCNNHISRH